MKEARELLRKAEKALEYKTLDGVWTCRSCLNDRKECNDQPRTTCVRAEIRMFLKSSGLKK